MNEPDGVSEPEGMGRPSGPGFAGPAIPGTPPSAPAPRQPAPAARPPLGPKPNRLPTVLTVAVITVVAAIVVVASVLAARNDVRQATPRTAPPAVAVSPVATDRIEFTTDTGSGVLEILDHSWASNGSDVHTHGKLLTVALRVTCTSGTVRYGPDSFQAFDSGGDLFDPEVLPDSPTALELGTLSAGQHVDGTVGFDIPRGGVTLLMSDESSRTVTALKVPD